jgi:hypothetical protein
MGCVRSKLSGALWVLSVSDLQAAVGLGGGIGRAFILGLIWGFGA